MPLLASPTVPAGRPAAVLAGLGELPSPLPFTMRRDGDARALMVGRAGTLTASLDVEVREAGTVPDTALELDVRYVLARAETRSAVHGRVQLLAADLAAARSALRRVLAGIAREAAVRAARGTVPA